MLSAPTPGSKYAAAVLASDIKLPVPAATAYSIRS